MTKLQQLIHDSFYNMQKYSQITIDIIQEVEDTLSKDSFGEQEREDVLSAMSYSISTVIEVLNPKLETDVKALLKLIEIIEDEIHQISI